MEQEAKTELTYGQKAVGLTFNPSGDDAVAQRKQAFAEEIDRIHAIQFSSTEIVPMEKYRTCMIAIEKIQTAQMWAVKALTWKD